jgi:hypothetical protein
VEIRIGVIHTMKELELELPSDVDPAQVRTDVETALADETRTLWFTDRHGQQVAVPSARIAYVELGTPERERRIGFGA